MTYRPSLCLIAQAAKRVMIGDQTLTYGHMQSLVITVAANTITFIGLSAGAFAADDFLF